MGSHPDQVVSLGADPPADSTHVLWSAQVKPASPGGGTRWSVSHISGYAGNSGISEPLGRRRWCGVRDYCINHHIPTRSPLPNACRTCGATSYRSVIARGSSGEMRQSGLFQCSGCSLVFADPKAWRDGCIDAVEANGPSVTLPGERVTPELGQITFQAT